MMTHPGNDPEGGIWTEANSLGGWDCSECGCSVYSEYAGLSEDDMVPFDYGWHYCPYCGAHIKYVETRQMNLHATRKGTGEKVVYLDYAK